MTSEKTYVFIFTVGHHIASILAPEAPPLKTPLDLPALYAFCQCSSLIAYPTIFFCKFLACLLLGGESLNLQTIGNPIVGIGAIKQVGIVTKMLLVVEVGVN